MYPKRPEHQGHQIPRDDYRKYQIDPMQQTVAAAQQTENAQT